MATYSALTTVAGQPAAEALGEAMDLLDPAPTGVGVFEIEDGSGRWEIGGYFGDSPDVAGLALLAAIHGAEDFAVSRIEDRDWVAQVRRELHPVHAGRFTVHGGHDADRVGPERVGLKIEAAMAFGTGHHGTTRGCLLLLDRMLRRGWRPARVADLGCGTGVLALAAARSVRARGWAGDIDPVAVATARANLAANGAAGLVRAVLAPGLRHPAMRAGAPYDLIFANILAGPLKRLAPDITAKLAPGGRVILAGLMTFQAPAVLAVFRSHGMIETGRVRLDAWTSLEMTRRARLPRRGARGRFRS